jgi:hypothetical protein
MGLVAEVADTAKASVAATLTSKTAGEDDGADSG